MTLVLGFPNLALSDSLGAVFAIVVFDTFLVFAILGNSLVMILGLVSPFGTLANIDSLLANSLLGALLVVLLSFLAIVLLAIFGIAIVLAIFLSITKILVGFLAILVGVTIVFASYLIG